MQLFWPISLSWETCLECTRTSTGRSTKVFDSNAIEFIEPTRLSNIPSYKQHEFGKVNSLWVSIIYYLILSNLSSLFLVKKGCSGNIEEPRNPGSQSEVPSGQSISGKGPSLYCRHAPPDLSVRRPDWSTNYGSGMKKIWLRTPTCPTETQKVSRDSCCLQI